MAAARDAVVDLVRDYLVDRVREAAASDAELFDRVQEIVRLVAAEREGRETEPGDDGEGSAKVNAGRAALKLLGGRAERLADLAPRVAEANRAVVARLRERLEAAGIDPSDPAQQAAAGAQYEAALAEVVSLDQSLEQVEAVAVAIDLVNELVNPSLLKRPVYEMAWSAGKRMLSSDEEVLGRLEALKQDLRGDRPRLEAAARAVRDVGPGIVTAAHERGRSVGREG